MFRRWTPTDDSYFDAVFSAIGAAYNSVVTERLLKKWGPKKTFERASIAQVIGFSCLAVAWRGGGSKLRASIQYVLCMAVLQHPWRETCAMAAKPCVLSFLLLVLLLLLAIASQPASQQ
eukprot:COSAG06_NODE_15826_length_1042_cov_0.870626_2_plen_118_part_01